MHKKVEEETDEEEEEEESGDSGRLRAFAQAFFFCCDFEVFAGADRRSLPEL